MDSLKKYDFLHKYLSLAGKLFGVDLLNPNWHRNIVHTFDLFLCFLATLSYFYNLHKFWEDFEFVCYSTIIFTPLLGGAYRLIYWPYKKSLARTLYEESLEFCKTFSNELRHRNIVEKYAIVYNFFITSMVLLFFNGIASLMLAPPIVYLLTGKKTLPLPVYIVGLDHQSHPGYELNYFMHLCDGYVAFVGFSYIQSLTLLYVGISTCQIEILRSKVTDLERQILLSADDPNETDVKRQFKEIIDLHNEFIEFSNKAEDLLNFQYFMDVTTLTVTVVTALFYAKFFNWLPGYFIALVILLAALFNYAFGEVNAIQLERLNNAAYNVSWYRMSVKMQKMYIIFLHKTQVSHFFTCGGLRPINVDLYASVLLCELI